MSSSDVVFPEKYYVEIFRKFAGKFPEIHGKVYVYFYILQYYIHTYILNIFNI